MICEHTIAISILNCHLIFLPYFTFQNLLCNFTRLFFHKSIKQQWIKKYKNIFQYLHKARDTPAHTCTQNCQENQAKMRSVSRIWAHLSIIYVTWNDRTYFYKLQMAAIHKNLFRLANTLSMKNPNQDHFVLRSSVFSPLRSWSNWTWNY